jgi:hypothetical protein
VEKSTRSSGSASELRPTKESCTGVSSKAPCLVAIGVGPLKLSYALIEQTTPRRRWTVDKVGLARRSKNRGSIMAGPSQELMRMGFGFAVSQALYVAPEPGIADLLTRWITER